LTDNYYRAFGGQTIQYLLDDRRVFDAGDDLDVTAAAVADLDVDIEYAFQALRLPILAISKGLFHALSQSVKWLQV
jgi:hypothetical protein